MLLFCLRRIGLLYRVLVAIAEKQKVIAWLLWKLLGKIHTDKVQIFAITYLKGCGKELAAYSES